MSENTNHTCAICGTKYHFCMDCGQAKTFTPWRTIVDTVEHYKIFMIISDYTNKHIDKAEAKEQLGKINLSELNDFVPEIKNVINTIMTEEIVQEVKETIVKKVSTSKKVK